MLDPRQWKQGLTIQHHNFICIVCIFLNYGYCYQNLILLSQKMPWNVKIHPGTNAHHHSQGQSPKAQITPHILTVLFRANVGKTQITISGPSGHQIAGLPENKYA